MEELEDDVDFGEEDLEDDPEDDLLDPEVPYPYPFVPGTGNLPPVAYAVPESKALPRVFVFPFSNNSLVCFALNITDPCGIAANSAPLSPTVHQRFPFQLCFHLFAT